MRGRSESLAAYRVRPALGLGEGANRAPASGSAQRAFPACLLARGARGFAGLTGLLATTVGGWIAYSALFIRHRAPLPDAIDAERRRFASPAAGGVSYYADRRGGGRPLALIHSINAAASAYEMRPLFEHFRGRRPVFALDLPGFGHSDRADRVYSPALYTAAVIDFLRVLAPGGAADVVALSLGSEFAARAALEGPDLVHSLTLISPSGFSARGEEGRSQRTSREGTGDRLLRAFSFPLWSQAFYDLLASPSSIRYFLRQSFAGPPDPGLVAYADATSHQPGARHAPLYFISGKLFSPDIRETVYERLRLPVLVLHDEDGFVRFDELPGVARRRANWRIVRIAPTRGLPHFERPVETARALVHFWQKVDDEAVG